MTDVDAKELARHDDLRWEALLAGDVEKVDDLFHDDLVYTHATGATDTKSTYLQSLIGRGLRYRSVARADVRSQVFGSTGVVTGQAEIHAEVEGKPTSARTRYSAIWSRSNGRWKLVGWHSCFDTM